MQMIMDTLTSAEALRWPCGFLFVPAVLAVVMNQLRDKVIDQKWPGFHKGSGATLLILNIRWSNNYK
jgi:hypothetical protein